MPQRAVQIINGEKPCSKCRRVLPLNNFHKDPDIKCGYRGTCKDCRTAQHLTGSVLPSHKCCAVCNQVLPIGRFSKRSVSNDGYHHKCGDCLRAYDRTQRRKQRAKGLCADCCNPSERYYCTKCSDQQKQRYALKNAQGLCQSCDKPLAPTSKTHCVDHAERTRARNAKRPVLSFDERVLTLAKQNYTCPICTDSLDIYTAHVDHNHFTGTNRGLLHRDCNSRTLETVENHFDDIARAVEYLKAHCGTSQTNTQGLPTI